MLSLNRIHQGDCLELLREVLNESIDILITDPPYSAPVITSFGRKKVINLADLSLQEFYFRSIKCELERVLKPNGRVFVFCDDKYYPILFAVFYDWLNKNLIIWDKGKIGMGNPIRKQHELIFYSNRESFEYNRTEGITHYPSIMKYSSEVGKIHGAQKPLKLVQDLILGFSNVGDVVMDLFSGSGTTCLAAKNLNRNFIGFELNPDYCKESNDRIGS